MTTISNDAAAIDTERLTMRKHRREDWRDCAQMWADPTVTRYITGTPLTSEEVWAKVHRLAGHWVLVGFGYWVVREKNSGRFVGEVGFGDFKREMTPAFGGAPEIGWVLMPWAQGRGFANEAVQAAHDWMKQHNEATRTVCMIDPANVASIRVAEKNGYREYARTEYKGQPTILFERL